jgi:hypothetical protein
VRNENGRSTTETPYPVTIARISIGPRPLFPRSRGLAKVWSTGDNSGQRLPQLPQRAPPTILEYGLNALDGRAALSCLLLSRRPSIPVFGTHSCGNACITMRRGLRGPSRLRQIVPVMS